MHLNTFATMGSQPFLFLQSSCNIAWSESQLASNSLFIHLLSGNVRQFILFVPILFVVITYF